MSFPILVVVFQKRHRRPKMGKVVGKTFCAVSVQAAIDKFEKSLHVQPNAFWVIQAVAGAMPQDSLVPPILPILPKKSENEVWNRHLCCAESFQHLWSDALTLACL